MWLRGTKLCREMLTAVSNLVTAGLSYASQTLRSVYKESTNFFPPLNRESAPFYAIGICCFPVAICQITALTYDAQKDFAKALLSLTKGLIKISPLLMVPFYIRWAESAAGTQ